MKKPLVSVIVPVYKVEKWLSRCVDSILAQTMEDFELLLIDDGSPDCSGEICDEYAVKDSRVRVFHKANGGVSSARNLGLDNAKGEWISFVDADDWVDVDYLAGLTENLDADFILGGVKMLETQQSSMEDYKYEKSEIKDCIEKYLFDTVLLSPWGNLLNRNIINNNNIRFDEKIRYAEDRIFNREYLLSCKSIISVSDLNYNYQIDERIDYSDKFKLTIKELDYLCFRIDALNKVLTDTFFCKLDENELKNYILSMFFSKSNMEEGKFCVFFDLCKKYYSNFTKREFYGDPYLSPFIKYLIQIKTLFLEKKYVDAKLVFERLICLIVDVPWNVRFNFRDCYLWLFLIKIKKWSIFKLTMNLYFLKRYKN